tara:strand:- start:2225 stop:3286 length:1062 start_codon:yes stop_codon:yes gene_type:complete
MSSTSQFTTFSDLYNGLLKATRTDGGNTATVEQAKRYINTAHADMHVGFAEKVPWAIRDHSVTSRTFASILGTIATSTIHSTPPVGGVTEHEYTINNEDLIDIPTRTKMVAVTSAAGFSDGREGTVVQTDSTPEDPQALNGYSNTFDDVYQVGDIVRFYQDDINMPLDFMRLAGNQIKIGSRDLELIGRVAFRHQFAGRVELGRPFAATLIDSWDHSENGLDQRKIRLFPIPDVAERIYITYVTKDIVVGAGGLNQELMSADGDVPIMPIRYRHAIFFHALYHWYRDRKDDTRSQEAKAEYIEIMSRIVNDTESGQSHMSIRPNTNAYRRKASRPYHRRGGTRYDFGSFDRLQ